ncbi:MAG: glycosyltransferase family 4 protein [Hyphomicrobiaceae bacterium]
MTLIFINRFFYPDHSATSQMLSDLAFALAAREHSVTVITSRQRYDAPEVILDPHESIDGVEIHRVKTSHFGRSNLLGRALDYVTFYLAAILAVWQYARRGDIIIAKTDPPMLSVVVAPIARLRRAKLINWLQDLFPEVAESLGVRHGPLTRPVYRTLKFLRDRSLRHATCNVAIGKRMAERLQALGVPEDRIEIIPNWADGSLVRPVSAPANPFRSEHQLEGVFVVGYSGNLGRAHDTDTIVAAMEFVEQHQSGSVVPIRSIRNSSSHVQSAPNYAPAPIGMRPIRWLFVGGGAQFERLKQEAARRNITSVLFAPYQPRERLSESLSAPDVHLISLRPELEGLIVPSKFYGIAAAGRPAIFIGDADGEIARILRESDTGAVVRQGDGEALAEIVLKMAADPAHAEEQGRRARSLFEREYDWPDALARWLRLIDDNPSPPRAIAGHAELRQ